jgi:hypothetical protein
MEQEKNAVQKYQEDFSQEEGQALQEFVKNGCPGITKVSEDKTFEWFRLYMSGKGYGEIATISGSKKELVLYFSHKLKWHEKKMSYYSDISATLFKKTADVKLESASTIASMVSALNQYFGDKFINYLKTKNSKHIEGIDTKMLAQYYKSLEMLEKLMGANSNTPQSPSVNINVGSNATIEEKNGTVTVTDTSAKDLLAALSKYKKNLAEDDD